MSARGARRPRVVRGSRRSVRAGSDPDRTIRARVALITAPDAETARRIARALVEERLAACVNLVPGLTSIYRWEGAVHEDAEVLLIVKTRANRLAALAERLAVLHPYALPELVAFAPSGGSERYLAWVCAESKRPSARATRRSRAEFIQAEEDPS